MKMGGLFSYPAKETTIQVVSKDAEIVDALPLTTEGLTHASVVKSGELTKALELAPVATTAQEVSEELAVPTVGSAEVAYIPKVAEVAEADDASSLVTEVLPEVVPVLALAPAPAPVPVVTEVAEETKKRKKSKKPKKHPK
jgi:hypothetical protein